MEEKQKPKIAIVHDHLGFGGGGERTVLLLALELNADFITAYVSPNTYPDYQKQLGEKLKVLAKGSVKMRVVRFFWLRNLFWRKRKLFKDYDILIASSQTATEAVASYSRKNASRIVYTHTTPRRVFDLYEVSKNMYPVLLRPAYAVFARYWKRRYLKAIKKFNFNVANSENVRQRIKNHTRGDANLVAWPPIMTEKFKWIAQGDYFLSYGRVDEAKRIDLIAKAFKKMPDKKLVIASGGPWLDRVREIARGSDNIKILGWVTDEELISLIGKSLATIYIPISEDAGMSHLESNVAGKPYLGVREGGLIESTIDGETGILLPENPTEEDVIFGVGRMTPEWCLSKKEKCEEHAKQYDKEVFFKKMKKAVSDCNPQIPILGIDASRWEDPRFPGRQIRTGVEEVSKNIIKEIVNQIKSKNIRLRLYTPRTIQSLPLNIQKVIPPGKNWTRIRLASELKDSPVDYFFTPAYYIPSPAPHKSFSIIHDVIFKTNPEKYSRKDRLKQNFAVRNNIKRSHKIFTISEFSKQEIIREYKLQSDKVIVMPMGYHCHFSGQVKIAERKETNPFILYIGRIEKKKSVDILVEAFAQFLSGHPDWKLVLAGMEGHGTDEIKSLISSLGIGKSVEMAGFVSNEKKWELLSSASLFVHPSAHEGSSIPIFEAWDVGVPVIATDAQIIKEIGKTAVEYFKAGDEKDLYQKMINLISNLQRINELRQNGRQNLNEHSWKKAAGIVLNEIIKK
jgi:glycosyltransferase involved in cell wall biosynthesis